MNPAPALPHPKLASSSLPALALTSTQMDSWGDQCSSGGKRGMNLRAGPAAPERRIAFGYESFGPYHIARLATMATRCRLLGIEFSRQSITYDWTPAARVPFDRRTLAAQAGASRTDVCQALSEFAPDVVFVPGWSAPQALAMLMWSLKHGVPAVLMSDSQEIDARRIKLLELVKGRLLRLFEGAFVAGRRHEQYLAQLGFSDRPLRMHYDVVDNDHFAPAHGSKAAEREYILCCARLVEKKNLSGLLFAYRAFLDRHGPEANAAPKLLILGEGPLRGELAALARRLGLGEKLEMPGFINYAAMPAAYHRARIFVLPSKTEQWGLVVNEAMAAGCPILVSSRAGCVPELLESGRNGFEFDPDKPDDLAEKLVSLNGRPDMLNAFGQRSLTVIAKHSLDAHARSALELADAVVRAPRRRGTWPSRALLRLVLAHSARGGQS